jgi:hypothetical protein
MSNYLKFAKIRLKTAEIGIALPLFQRISQIQKLLVLST